jgi:hypothetical protein
VLPLRSMGRSLATRPLPPHFLQGAGEELNQDPLRPSLPLR